MSLCISSSQLYQALLSISLHTPSPSTPYLLLLLEGGVVATIPLFGIVKSPDSGVESKKTKHKERADSDVLLDLFDWEYSLGVAFIEYLEEREQLSKSM